jgi:hypothetical protein
MPHPVQYLFTATVIMRTHISDKFYVQSLFSSTLSTIAVHIHSVFCVPFNVCDNVQLCADKDILLW